ncbi:MAG: class I SAM-dependent methyltransferase [Pseudomonadota bacterium]
MIDTRLELALGEGKLVLPSDGRIAVFGPPQNARLDALPKERCEIIEGFKPALDAWQARGFSCSVLAKGRFAGAVLSLPRSKSLARVMLAEAAGRTDGPLVIDGQKTDGIDSILKELRKRVDVSGPLSKAHGKLFWCVNPDADVLEDWRHGPERTPGGFWTAPGVFSESAIDPASAMLAAVLPDDLGRTVADLGAGWGLLSAHVLTREDVVSVHLVEAQYIALECARRNVGDPRAVFHWEDATLWTPEEPVDTVVMNPPFHSGRAADPALGQAFVRAAARVLKPQGGLWMVANRHLPYEHVLTDRFAKVNEIGGDGGFKVLHASRPKRVAG